MKSLGRAAVGVSLLAAVSLASCNHPNVAGARRVPSPPLPTSTQRPLKTRVSPLDSAWSYGPKFMEASYRDEPELKIGDGNGEATIVFARPAIPAHCIRSARLVLPRIWVSRGGALAAYPSAARGFVKHVRPQIPGQLINNRPKGLVLLSKHDTHARIVVTQLTRAWLTNNIEANESAGTGHLPLMYTLQPPGLISPVTVSIDDSGHDRPRLALTYEPASSCSQS